MKKILAFIVICIFAITTYAQNQVKHLRFMGIPITGTIAQFQTKLISKGFKLDRNESAKLPNGYRIFTGVLAGNTVEICTFYNAKTKIVYRVKAIHKWNTEDEANDIYNRLKKLYSQKYEYYHEGTTDGFNSTVFFDIDNTKKITEDTDLYNVCNGHIGLFIQENNLLAVFKRYYYEVHVDYNDTRNTESNENSIIDEL